MSLGQIQIARIAVDNSAILKDKFFVDIDIVDIGGGGFNSIDHAETSPRQYMPSFQNTTVLLGLVHLRIPLFLLILCRTGRSDDGGVNNSADPVHETGLFKTCIQLCKKVFALLKKGYSIRNVAKLTGKAVSTIQQVKKKTSLIADYRNKYCIFATNTSKCT